LAVWVRNGTLIGRILICEGVDASVSTGIIKPVFPVTLLHYGGDYIWKSYS